MFHSSLTEPLGPLLPNVIILFIALSVTQSFDTGLETIGPITLFSDGTVAFWGYEENTHKLKQYNPHTGTERTCVNLSGEPWGNAEVTVEGIATLALSYG